MSDLLELHADVNDAASKRYHRTISVGDSEYEIMFRQAYDPETSAFIGRVGKDTFDEWQDAFNEADDTDEEKLQRLQKLAQKAKNGRLSDDEEQELEQLKEETDEAQDGIYKIVENPDAVGALQDMACSVVEPDDNDIQTILQMNPEKQNQRFGEYATNEGDAYDMAKSMVEDIVTKSTDFSSVMIGLNGLFIGQSGGNDQN